MLTPRTLAACVASIVAATCVMAAARVHAAPAEKEQKLIQVLQSDAPPQEKAITCKRLAIYGTEAAVPSLAPLLADEQLASWSRIALEVIPGPAADDALRAALGKLEGRLLIGVINSIGVRRDAKAVGALIGLLKNADVEVAAAAAEALGRIGGKQGAQALEQCLSGTPAAVRSSAAIGCVLCAERFLAEGQAEAAVRLYDVVRKAELPEQRHLEATRGAILARGADGVPLLLEQLRSKDKARFGIGLRTARELPGPEATEALAAELGRMVPQRKVFLLLALADRGDPKALPAVLGAARSGEQMVRLTAVGALERLGDISCVPALLDIAIEDNDALANKAKVALARLPGQGVNKDIVARLRTASGKKRRALIEVAMHRRIEAAMPAFVQCAHDTDPAVRKAAVAAIGVLGGGEQVDDLVKVIQKTQDPKEQASVGKALRAVSARGGAACVPHLMPLARSQVSSHRAIALHALASAGGPDALAAVRGALSDRDEAIRDEAVRTLSGWPSNWPHDASVMEPLLTLATKSKKTLHQVLALRGYLQCVQGATKITDEDKLAKVDAVLPRIKRPEEKRLVISVLATIGAAGALDRLVAFAAEPAVAEEACSAIVQLVGKKGLKGIAKEKRQDALQTVVRRSKSSRKKRQAQQLLKRLR